MKQSAPPPVRCAIGDPRPAYRETASAMMQGHYILSGAPHILPKETPFRTADPLSAHEDLQGFGWLRHFSACASADARRHAKNLAQDWLRSDWAKPSRWSSPVAARRLLSWLSNPSLLLADQQEEAKREILRSLHRHARFLKRRLWRQSGESAGGRLTASCALALYGCSFPERPRLLETALARLSREIARQIFFDGGHVSRNPAAHLSILFDLLLLRQALLQKGRPPPQPLSNAIDRLAPMLRFFRHGDGGLALFNGASEGEAADVKAALALDDAGGRPYREAPHAGYQRLAAGRSLILMDTGAPPPAPFARRAHAGCLSFEMSRGRHRFFVNCGGGEGLSEEWRRAARQTAAHSTLAFLNQSSARLSPRLLRPADREKGAPIRGGPRRIHKERGESEKGVWIDAAHDGYRGRGFLHRRRLFLQASGKALEGEDRLEPVHRLRSLTRRQAEPFAIRFHLHPEISAAPLLGKDSILLRLPNGEGWQMRARVRDRKRAARLEESVYLGEAGRVRRARQIVIPGEAKPGEDFSVRWQVRRIGAEGSAEGSGEKRA